MSSLIDTIDYWKFQPRKHNLDDNLLIFWVHFLYCSFTFFAFFHIKIDVFTLYKRHEVSPHSSPRLKHHFLREMIKIIIIIKIIYCVSTPSFFRLGLELQNNCTEIEWAQNRETTFNLQPPFFFFFNASLAHCEVPSATQVQKFWSRQKEIVERDNVINSNW